MISIDTETTGTDLYHGCKPYIVTTCDEDGNQYCWEWDIDPETREPIIPKEELEEVTDFLARDRSKVLHNSTFDARALQTIGIEWDWEGTEDTLAASHILSTNTPHDLTSLCLEYLGLNVQPFEDRIKEATNLARQICKRELPHWRIAKPGDHFLPSVRSSSDNSRGTESESFWKADMWLPKALLTHHPELVPEDTVEGWMGLGKASDCPDHEHSWSYLCSEYANSDTASTILLWKRLEELIQEQGLESLYKERLKILPIVCKIQNRGMTLNRNRLQDLKEDYTEHVETASDNLRQIARRYDYELEVPKGATNDSLKSFCFGFVPRFKSDGKMGCKVCGKIRPKTQRGIEGWRKRIGQPVKSKAPLYCSERCYKKRIGGSWLNLPVVERSPKTQEPTTNKKAMQIYEHTLEGEQKEFCNSLTVKRKLGKSLEYIESYQKFWLPLKISYSKRHPETDLDSSEWFRLHPSLNPFGTDTLRWSSHNPSQQVISKQKDHNDRNLRYIFGPAPGRVWYSLDYDNLELRIPAYECKEPAMLELFESPDTAPYYGSYHLLIFSILHPDKYDHDDPEGLLKAKEKYTSTWYSWTKNGNFAELYGAIDTGDGMGTADVAFHVPGAQAIISKRLKEKNRLNKYWIDYANKHGYVETLPDKSIDPNRGYPIQCRRGRYNKVVETTPLNYHVQGTACWVMMRAMIEIQKLLDTWNEGLSEPQYFMIANVHDEVLLDFPSGKRNKAKVKAVQRTMERIGNDIGVTLTCGCDRIDETWLKGQAV